MASIGVYWIPAFGVLEARGFNVILLNARHAGNVPGRRTHVSDAGWLRQQHPYGLLRGSFRPEAEIATLRACLRQRERLVEYAAAHLQQMQKAQREMNLQLHHVVSDTPSSFTTHNADTVGTGRCHRSTSNNSRN